MYIVPLRVAQAEELFLGVLLQGVGKGGLCNIGMALTGFCVFLILGSKMLAISSLWLLGPWSPW